MCWSPGWSRTGRRISYAVGEWARVWPLSALIRAMGAYFIRRGSRNALYRRVLARYVQMATAEGTTQAIFPEGGLSLDGRVGPAKLGLLSYIVEGYEPGGRDVVFVPVGLAYDRVLEDRVLIEAAAGGHAAVSRPASGDGWLCACGSCGASCGGGSRALARRRRVLARRCRCGRFWRTARHATEALGAQLMAAIAEVVPVLPVPLVGGGAGRGRGDARRLRRGSTALVERLAAAGAVLKLPPQGLDGDAGRRAGPADRARAGEPRTCSPCQRSGRLLAFYAASVQRLRRAERCCNAADIKLQNTGHQTIAKLREDLLSCAQSRADSAARQ